MQFRNSRSLASAPALAAIANLNRSQASFPSRAAQAARDAFGRSPQVASAISSEFVMPWLDERGAVGEGYRICCRRGSLPLKRGRVGVGVDSTMWSAAVSLSNWRSETPSRLAALAELPLSGGGEEPLASNAIPFGGRERSAKAGVETENNKSHHGEGKGG